MSYKDLYLNTKELYNHVRIGGSNSTGSADGVPDKKEELKNLPPLPKETSVDTVNKLATHINNTFEAEKKKDKIIQDIYNAFQDYITRKEAEISLLKGDQGALSEMKNGLNNLYEDVKKTINDISDRFIEWIKEQLERLNSIYETLNKRQDTPLTITIGSETLTFNYEKAPDVKGLESSLKSLFNTDAFLNELASYGKKISEFLRTLPSVDDAKKALESVVAKVDKGLIADTESKANPKA